MSTKMNNFKKWITTFLDEKGINLDNVLEVEGQSGTNFIPVDCLVEMMVGAPERERVGIKNMIVKIDFLNGDVMDYFKHLARAVAK